MKTARNCLIVVAAFSVWWAGERAGIPITEILKVFIGVAVLLFVFFGSFLFLRE